MNKYSEPIITSGPLFNSLQLLQAYEQAIDANIISSITDTKGIIVHANKKFCEVSKYAASEIIGLNHSIINSGFHPKDFFKSMWMTIAAGEVWHDEIRNKAKDGSFYWVDTVIVPIKDTQQKITHYLSLRTLITSKKQLEKKKAQYVSSLEGLLVVTSSKLRTPLANCLKQIDSFDSGKTLDADGLQSIMVNLKSTTHEIDNFTKELTLFLREINI